MIQGVERIEFKVTWPRRDRNERQHQTFRSIVSAMNKIQKLEKALYKDIYLYERTVIQHDWKKRE